MAGARQNTSIQSSLVSIFKKIDTMVDSIVSTNEANLLVLGDIQSIVKVDISTELKKQTSILKEIKNKITGSKKPFKEESSTTSLDSDKKNFSIFGNAFSVIVKAANKITPKTAENVKVFIKSLVESLKDLNTVDFTKATNAATTINSILLIGKNALKFAGYMVLFALISPIVKIGISILAWTIKSLSTIELPDAKTIDVIQDLIAIGHKILLFGLSLAGFALIAIPAAIGVLAFVGIVKILSIFIKDQNKKTLDGLEIIVKIGLGIIVFGLALTAVALLAPKILIGAIVAASAISLISLALIITGNPKVKEGTRSLLWLSLGIVTLGLSLFTFNLLVNPAQSVLSILVIGGLGLVMGFIGIMSNSITKGSMAMLLAAAPITLLAISMFIWQMANITWESIGQVLTTVLGVGVLMGIAGLAAPYIALGALSMGLSAIAILVMTWALKEFQKLNWTQKNSDNLKYTIKSVLSALSGTNEKKGILSNLNSVATQGLSAITSLFSIGPLILGSAAIYAMSIALEKFQSLNWTPANTQSLSGVITSVLDAVSKKSSPYGQPTLGGQILDTMISLMTIGTLVRGSVALWLFSLALEKFKSVQWTPDLTVKLSSTITAVLGAVGNASTIKVNPGLGILQTILSLIGAGSIFVAGAGVWLFSESLLKFKNVKWDTTKDSASLKSAISGVITTLNDSVGLLSGGEAKAKAVLLSSIAYSLQNFFNSLKSFKNLNWTSSDTALIKNAIDTIFAYDDTKKYDGLTKVANNFKRIADYMGTMKSHINTIDIKKLTLTESMMKSIAALSKDPNAIAGTIRTAIEQAFQKMTEEMNAILTEVMTKNSTMLTNSINNSFEKAISSNTNKSMVIQPTVTTNPAIKPVNSITGQKPGQFVQANTQDTSKLAEDIADAFIKALHTAGFKVAVKDDFLVVK